MIVVNSYISRKKIAKLILNKYLFAKVVVSFSLRYLTSLNPLPNSIISWSNTLSNTWKLVRFKQSLKTGKTLWCVGDVVKLTPKQFCNSIPVSLPVSNQKLLLVSLQTVFGSFTTIRKMNRMARMPNWHDEVLL